MIKQMWSIRKAAMWGAILGVPSVLFHFREYLLWSSPEQVGGNIGQLIGDIGGGVVIFTGVAAIRNTFARRHNQRIDGNLESSGVKPPAAQ
jgi:hypothetical protein